MKQKNTPISDKEKKVPPRAGKVEDVSPEALKERDLLSSLLINGADERAQADRLKRLDTEREIPLLSGKTITLAEIEREVTALRQPYEAKFPNDHPFFKEMFRLLKWTDRDPNNYNKPAIVGEYINQIIYARFHKDVQPTLQALAVPGGIRLYKFSQYLTAEGQVKLEQYRDEATALMKDCSDWYEFRVKYGELYNLTVQKRMFEQYTNREAQP